MTVSMNTYSNSAGNIRCKGFADQDSLLRWKRDRELDGTLLPRQVLWMGNVGSLWGESSIRQLYRTLFGSANQAVIKDYVLQAQLKIVKNKWAETFTSMLGYMGGPKWLFIWRGVDLPE